MAERLTRAKTAEEVERCYLADARRLASFPAAGICLVEPNSDRAWRTAGVGVSDFFLSRYERFGRARDPVYARVRHTHRVASSRMLLEDESERSREMHSELGGLHRWNLCVQVPILSGDQFLGTLNFGGAEEHFPDEEEVAVLEQMGRLVGVAVLEAMSRRDEARRHQRTIAALAASGEALVVTDVALGERVSTPAADRLLAMLDLESSDCLDRLMLSGEDGLPLVRSEPVGLRDGRTAKLHLRVVEATDLPGVAVSILQLEEQRPTAVRSDLRRWLTPRECEVADRVVRGMRDGEIAAELHLSPHTVRDHIKSIYRKTGVSSRVMLAGLVLGDTDSTS